MRVFLDNDRCQGHGRCYALAPTIFTDDERGHAVLCGDDALPPAMEDEVRPAELACPEGAITVEE